MSNDIAYMKGWNDSQSAYTHLVAELEAQVESQKAEIQRLRAALKKIANGWIDPAVGGDCKDCDMGLYQNLGHLPECVFEIARKALE